MGDDPANSSWLARGAIDNFGRGRLRLLALPRPLCATARVGLLPVGEQASSRRRQRRWVIRLVLRGVR